MKLQPALLEASKNSHDLLPREQIKFRHCNPPYLLP